MWRVLCWVVSVMFPVGLLAADEVVEVEIARLSDVAIYAERSTSARVESLHRSRLSAQISAEVVALPVLPGERVNAGDILLQLDPDDVRVMRDIARARLQAARAETSLAQVRLERARSLSGEEFVSVDQLAEAETRYQMAQARQQEAEQQLSAAELDFSRANIMAPFDGILVERTVSLGERVSVGEPLMLLLDTKRLEVVANLPVVDVDSLSDEASPYLLTPHGQLPLRVLRITDAVEAGARTQQIRLGFAGESALVGVEGRLIWNDPRARVPAALVQKRQGRLGVFLVADERARFHAFDAAEEGRAVRVDLAPDTMLVTKGHQRLQDGQRVRF